MVEDVVEPTEQRPLGRRIREMKDLKINLLFDL
jgi:hypothetical protein